MKSMGIKSVRCKNNNKEESGAFTFTVALDISKAFDSLAQSFNF